MSLILMREHVPGLKLCRKRNCDSFHYRMHGTSRQPDLREAASIGELGAME
jgi:hypothetical protein